MDLPQQFCHGLGTREERAGGDFTGDVSVSTTGEGSTSAVVPLPRHRAAPSTQPLSALPWQERAG